MAGRDTWIVTDPAQLERGEMSIIDPYPWPCDTWPPTDLPKLLLADELIRLHNDALDRLYALVDDAGGFSGATKRIIDELEQRGLITSFDNARLKSLVDLFHSGDADTDGVLSSIDKLNDDSRNDAGSSALAIASVGIAASSMRRAIAVDRFGHGQVE